MTGNLLIIEMVLSSTRATVCRGLSKFLLENVTINNGEMVQGIKYLFASMGNYPQNSHKNKIKMVVGHVCNSSMRKIKNRKKPGAY